VAAIATGHHQPTIPWYQRPLRRAGRRQARPPARLVR
jgi:hypothetical protein